MVAVGDVGGPARPPEVVGASPPRPPAGRSHYSRVAGTVGLDLLVIDMDAPIGYHRCSPSAAIPESSSSLSCGRALRQQESPAEQQAGHPAIRIGRPPRAGNQPTQFDRGSCTAPPSPTGYATEPTASRAGATRPAGPSALTVAATSPSGPAVQPGVQRRRRRSGCEQHDQAEQHDRRERAPRIRTRRPSLQGRRRGRARGGTARAAAAGSPATAGGRASPAPPSPPAARARSRSGARSC